MVPPSSPPAAAAGGAPVAGSVPAANAAVAPSFEAALAELEALVERMEGGELPLKDALAAYKRGALLLQFCQGALKDARQEVLVLEKGVLRAFEADADDEP